MTNLSRRAFLRGAAASAAVSVPLTPHAVAWFSKWFQPRKFYSFAGKEPPRPTIKIYEVESFHFEYSINPLDRMAAGNVRLSEPKVQDYGGVKVPARIIDAKRGIVEIIIPEVHGSVILQGDIRIDKDA